MSLASSFIVQDSKPMAVSWSDWLPLRRPGKVNIVGWQTGGGHGMADSDAAASRARQSGCTVVL
jgi:hypothetical protein